MLSFEQAKNEIVFQVVPDFIKSLSQTQNKESAQIPTQEFVQQIAKLLLIGTLSYD